MLATSREIIYSHCNQESDRIAYGCHQRLLGGLLCKPEKNEAALERTIKLARERNIVIPTLHQMAHPEDIPENKRSLKYRSLGH